MKAINKKTEAHIPKLKTLFQKTQLFKSKIKHLYLSSKSKTLSSFNTTNINFQNYKKRKKYELKKNNFCKKRAKTDFFKSIPNYTRTMFPYKELSKKNSDTLSA
jgi:hypothetical protein